MAYRIKLKEPMERAFVRICSEQIERAGVCLATVADDATLSIHSTRKCLKRTRAALRFFRPLLTPDDYAETNGGLRDVGRALSARRDSDVLQETINLLQAENVFSRPVSARLSKAVASARTDGGAADPPTIETQTQRLAAIKNRLAEFKLDAELAGEHAIFTGGLERALDDCGEAFDAWCGAEDDPEMLHEWRKTVQLHWRHMQLVNAAWPALCSARVEEARAISALTGKCRDLGLLVAFAKSQRLPAATIAAVTSGVEQRIPALRAAARWHGERLLAGGTRGFCRRLEDYWRSARGLRKAQAVKAIQS